MEGCDDAVEFHIFLDPTAQETPAEARLRCHAALIAICGRLAPRLQGCVWHRDPFEIWLWDPERDAAQAPLMAAGKAEMHLWGRMSFGESIDDEWFAVGLLLQLSAEQARSVDTCTPSHRLRVPDSRVPYVLEAQSGLPRGVRMAHQPRGVPRALRTLAPAQAARREHHGARCGRRAAAHRGGVLPAALAHARGRAQPRLPPPR